LIEATDLHTMSSAIITTKKMANEVPVPDLSFLEPPHLASPDVVAILKSFA